MPKITNSIENYKPQIVQVVQNNLFASWCAFEDNYFPTLHINSSSRILSFGILHNLNKYKEIITMIKPIPEYLSLKKVLNIEERALNSELIHFRKKRNLSWTLTWCLDIERGLFEKESEIVCMVDDNLINNPKEINKEIENA